MSVPDEGYSSNVPDEGYSSNVPDEGYSRNVPDEGYSTQIIIHLLGARKLNGLNTIPTTSKSAMSPMLEGGEP